MAHAASERDLEAFRAEVRAWLEAHAPEGLRGTRKGRFEAYWGGRKTPAPSDDVRRWLTVMAERGWTAPTWPTAYGGAGLSRSQARIIDQEISRLRLPPPLVGFGQAMIGPTLLDFGSEAQKQQHVPPIVRGEIRWCQGYSEPGAGSDLASLATRAVRDGDHLVVTGQKIWTTYAEISDWIFCLVRTNPAVKKQAGITFVLIDMDSPGVEVRPIHLISGASPFCEVFLEDVRVPLAQVVGEIDAGWTIAKALLGYERTIVGEAMGAGMLGLEDKLVALARAQLSAEEGPLPSGALRDRIAGFAMDEACFKATIQRVQEGMAAGRAPGPESSILKIAGSELKQRRWRLTMDIAGPEALGWEGETFDPILMQSTREWLRSRGNTIEGGTSEIQLNILAKRILGLG